LGGGEGGGGGSLYSEIHAEAGARKVRDFEDEQPGKNGEIVGIRVVIVEIIRVVLIDVPDSLVSDESHQGATRREGCMAAKSHLYNSSCSTTKLKTAT
jgi:hypothetical protein